MLENSIIDDNIKYLLHVLHILETSILLFVIVFIIVIIYF